MIEQDSHFWIRRQRGQQMRILSICHPQPFFVVNHRVFDPIVASRNSEFCCTLNQLYSLTNSRLVAPNNFAIQKLCLRVSSSMTRRMFRLTMATTVEATRSKTKLVRSMRLVRNPSRKTGNSREAIALRVSQSEDPYRQNKVSRYFSNRYAKVNPDDQRMSTCRQRRSDNII